MKKLLTTLTLTLALSMPLHAMLRDGNNFRGVLWGAYPQQVKNIQLLSRDGQYETYAYKDPLGTPLPPHIKEEETGDNITYTFHKNYGFTYATTVTGSSEQDYFKIEKAITDQFGYTDEGITFNLRWVGDNTIIILTYNPVSNRTTYIFASAQILQKLDEEGHRFPF